MIRKNERVGVRLAGDDLLKAEQVAILRGCSLSEAIRVMIRGTQVKVVTLVEIVPSESENRVLA